MIVGACHSTSALVINPCTIANSFGSWLQHAPCQSRRRRKGLAARVVLEGIGGFPLSAVWRSGAVNGGPVRTGPSERKTWRSIAATSGARRLSIGPVGPIRVASSIAPRLEQSGGGLPVAERASGHTNPEIRTMRSICSLFVGVLIARRPGWLGQRFVTNWYAGPYPARKRRPTMLSKLSLSLAAALALSATAGGGARANPIPTSTDEARALSGQVISQQHVDATDPADGPVTSTDQARALAGRSLPASPGAWMEETIARNTDEGRAAAVAGHQEQNEKERLAAGPAVAGTAEQGN